jgi:hypothetical protein
LPSVPCSKDRSHEAGGGGKRLFCDDGVLRSLRLVEGQVTTTEAFLATYATSAPHD